MYLIELREACDAFAKNPAPYLTNTEQQKFVRAKSCIKKKRPPHAFLLDIWHLDPQIYILVVFVLSIKSLQTLDQGSFTRQLIIWWQETIPAKGSSIWDDIVINYRDVFPSTNSKRLLQSGLRKYTNSQSEEKTAVNSDHHFTSRAALSNETNLRLYNRDGGAGPISAGTRPAYISPYSTAAPNNLGEHDEVNRENCSRDPQIMSARQTGPISSREMNFGYRTATLESVTRCLPEYGRPEIPGQRISSIERPFQILNETSSQPYNQNRLPQPGYADGTGHLGKVMPTTDPANVAQNLRWRLPAPKPDGEGHIYADPFNAKTKSTYRDKQDSGNSRLKTDKVIGPILYQIKLRHYLDIVRRNHNENDALPGYLLGSITSLGLESTSKVGDYCTAVIALVGDGNIIMEMLTGQGPKVKSGESIIARPSPEIFMIIGSYAQRRKTEEAASLMIAT